MTEGSHPSPKSAMKVVMNRRVIMVTVEHLFSYLRLLLVYKAPAPIAPVLSRRVEGFPYLHRK